MRNYLGTLSAVFNFAIKRKWATANPLRDVELPAIEQSDEIYFLEVDEVEALVAAAVEGPYEPIERALYATAAKAGLRQGELLALRWRDVDWRAARIRVRQNFVLGDAQVAQVIPQRADA